MPLPTPSSIYRLAPGLAIESFEDEALVLLAMQDRFVRVNRAAGELLVLMQSTLEDRDFSVAELAFLLGEHYDLTPPSAQEQAHVIIALWQEHGILIGADAGHVEARYG